LLKGYTSEGITVEGAINEPGGYAGNSDPLSAVDIELSVYQNQTGEYALYRSKQVSQFNNGAINKTEIFDQTGKLTASLDHGDPVEPTPPVIDNQAESKQNKYWLAGIAGGLLVLIIFLVLVFKRRRTVPPPPPAPNI
jgi:hypothetical protein